MAVGQATRNNANYLSRSSSLPSSWAALTICGHFKWSAASANNDTLCSVIGSAGDYSWLGFNAATSNLQVWNTGQSFSSTIATPSVGDDIFWALVHDGSTLRGYISVNNGTMATQSVALTSRTIASIRLLQDNSGNDGAAGYMSHVRVWDAILSQSELEAERTTAWANRATNLLTDSPLPGIYQLNGWAITGTLGFGVQSTYPTKVPHITSKGTFQSGTGALTVPWPASGTYATGDLAILAVESANEAIATPSGWTEFSNSPQSTGTAAAAGGVRLAAFYKYAASASEASVSVADTGNHTTAQIFTIKDTTASSSIDVTAGGVLSTAGTTVTWTGVTTSLANELVLLLMANDRDLASTTNLSAWTNSNLYGLGEIHDQTVASGVGGGLGLACGWKKSAGATGNSTVTNAASVTAAWLTIAIKSQDTAQSLTQSSRFDNSQTWYGPTITTGAVSLSASLVTNDQTWYGPTITQAGANQDLSQNTRFDNSQNWYGPTLTPGAVNLTATRLENSQTWYGPTLTPGAVTLSATRLENSQNWYGPTITTGAVGLTATLVENSQTWYGPTITLGPATLSPSRYDNSQTWYTHTLTVGAVNLSATRYDNEQTWYGHTLTQGGANQNLSQDTRLDNSPSFYAHTLTPGAVVLLPTLVENTQNWYGPTLSPGAVSLSAARYDNSQGWYGHTILPGAVNLSATRLENSQSWYGLRVDLGLFLERYANVQAWYGPTLTPGAVGLTAPFWSNQESFFSATVWQPGTTPTTEVKIDLLTGQVFVFL